MSATCQTCLVSRHIFWDRRHFGWRHYQHSQWICENSTYLHLLTTSITASIPPTLNGSRRWFYASNMISIHNFPSMAASKKSVDWQPRKPPRSTPSQMLVTIPSTFWTEPSSVSETFYRAKPLIPSILHSYTRVRVYSSYKHFQSFTKIINVFDFLSCMVRSKMNYLTPAPLAIICMHRTKQRSAWRGWAASRIFFPRPWSYPFFRWSWSCSGRRFIL